MFKQLSDIDLRLLRVFVTVVEARGFTAAESHLNIATSTISIHISNLEKRIGFRLCERGRSGFRLTERGRLVYQETKSILRSLEDFSGTLANIKSKLTGRLTIGVSDALVTHPDFSISDVVRQFNKIDNDVTIELLIAPKQNLESEVVDGRLHTAIGPFIPAKAGLDLTVLFQEVHDVYCGVGHPFFCASRNVAENCDLSEFPAVVRSYHREFDINRLNVLREAALVDTTEGMLSMLLSGNYVGYLPRHYAMKWVSDGHLAQLLRDDLTYVSKHGVITKSGSRISSALETFISIATKTTAIGTV